MCCQEYGTILALHFIKKLYLKHTVYGFIKIGKFVWYWGWFIKKNS